TMKNALRIQHTALRILGILGGLALALCVIGTYGLMAYVVTRRTREIGVRIALGATRGSVMKLILTAGLRLGFIALVIGLPLALGIGANTAIFSIINGVLLKPLPYREQEKLVTLWERNPQRGVEQEFVTPPNYADWREQSRVFEQMAYWNGVQQLNLVTTDGVEKARRAHVESSFFSVLRVAPLLGRTFLSEEDKRQGNRVAVLSHALWQRRFG